MVSCSVPSHSLNLLKAVGQKRLCTWWSALLGNKAPASSGAHTRYASRRYWVLEVGMGTHSFTILHGATLANHRVAMQKSRKVRSMLCVLAPSAGACRIRRERAFATEKRILRQHICCRRLHDAALQQP